MKLRAFRVNEQMRLETVAFDGSDLDALRKRGPVWVDVEEAETDEIEALVSPLSLHPLAIEGCVESSEGMRVEVFDGAIVLAYPGGDLSDRDPSYTRTLCLSDLLVTFSDGPLPELEATLARSAVRLHKNSIAGNRSRMLALVTVPSPWTTTASICCATDHTFSGRVNRSPPT